MADRLTDILVAPVTAVDPSSWDAALEEAKGILAGLAVRRAGAGPFRVTGHEVRAALCGDAADLAEQPPFAWSAHTARRGPRAGGGTPAGRGRRPLSRRGGARPARGVFGLGA